ncbi:MAG: hypothetical protein J6P81_04255, partial [Spirochaetales bacterium]|nr:hypothetical protein [Spirochaetales bacterium]
MEKKTVLAIILITLVLTVSMVIQGTFFTNNTTATATAETEQTQSTPVSEDASQQTAVLERKAIATSSSAT